MVLWKKKMPKLEDKPFYEVSKIAGKVFDEKTVHVLASLIHKKAFVGLDYPISTGKEAIVFRARAAEGFVAVKVFKFETTAFRRMQDYITGDPRFRLKHSLRENVKLWARKEFSNLKTCFKAGLSVPEPIFRKDNVVVMEFLGEEGVPFALLEHVVLENPQKVYEDVVEQTRKIYSLGLIHADLSSFNIIMKHDKPFIIDFGQAVVKEHPKAGFFLRKDCNNIASFFARAGVDTNADEVFSKVTSTQP